ncbi:hypothetical protein G6F40_016710 [Rhizopus arrhizus]|nr:hypothetical protein G6F40_016710 [Rhizopus arrhizus]
MPYVDARWLGGMLTNFKTVKTSVKRLKDMEVIVADGGAERMIKKEGHEPPAGRHLRDRHRPRRHRDQGSQEAGHPGHRRGRHQLQPGTG